MERIPDLGRRQGRFGRVGSENRGDFPVGEVLPGSHDSVSLSAAHSYLQPDTYFAVLRVASHRDGDMQKPYGLARNVARVPMVVS